MLEIASRIQGSGQGWIYRCGRELSKREEKCTRDIHEADRERERVNRNAGGATIRVVGGRTGRDSDLEPGTERVLESGEVGGIDSNKC